MINSFNFSGSFVIKELGGLNRKQDTNEIATPMVLNQGDCYLPGSVSQHLETFLGCGVWREQCWDVGDREPGCCRTQRRRGPPTERSLAPNVGSAAAEKP